MKRTITDIRENMPHVGCDNATALEMCDEIERLRRDLDLYKAVVMNVCLTLGHSDHGLELGQEPR